MTYLPPSLNISVQDTLQNLKQSLQLTQMEFGRLKAPLSIQFYEKWIAQNFHGNMAYLKNHLDYKRNPKLLNENLNSVISIAQAYFPAVDPVQAKTPARTALYAQNNDYHHWLKKKLEVIAAQLQKQYPDAVFLPYVDSGPILERDLAYQNRLGWFGKNTCLIHPEHGSLFFVAEILTSLKVDSENLAPLPDFCGKCTKCIDICPTGAIKEPRVLKADECISYLTIESKENPPPELRKKIGDWFFGCDLCQAACPWNEKVFRTQKIAPSDLISTETQLSLNENQRSELVAYFKFLLTSSHKQIQKYHFGSPLLRAGAKGLKRNALIVIANRNLTELKNEVRELAEKENNELAGWTLQNLVDDKA